MVGGVQSCELNLTVPYNEHRRRFFEIKYSNLHREEEKHTAALNKKKTVAETYKNRQARAKEERKRILLAFNNMDVNQKLLMIVNDQAHLPHYYPIKLMDISDDVLRALPTTTLETILKEFSKYEKHEWQNFYSRILNILT